MIDKAQTFCNTIAFRLLATLLHEWSGRVVPRQKMAIFETLIKFSPPSKINANYFCPIYCVYATYCPIIKKYRK